MSTSPFLARGVLAKQLRYSRRHASPFYLLTFLWARSGKSSGAELGSPVKRKLWGCSVGRDSLGAARLTSIASSTAKVKIDAMQIHPAMAALELLHRESVSTTPASRVITLAGHRLSLSWCLKITRFTLGFDCRPWFVSRGS